MKVIKVDQSKLTSECWLIQFQGLCACEKCEFKNTEDCGGKKIRETLERKEEEEQQQIMTSVFYGF